MTFIKSAQKRAEADDCFFCDYVRVRQDRTHPAWNASFHQQLGDVPVAPFNH